MCNSMWLSPCSTFRKVTATGNCSPFFVVCEYHGLKGRSHMSVVVALTGGPAHYFYHVGYGLTTCVYAECSFVKFSTAYCLQAS
ncbi:hypothetical protein SCLCIDRAFT_434226 [Scleroderma citrinum Foug A]|uniref:Uncharacterized protein n=1 Tax=Scleroderma citrinum Foug A TaxID=1036808 RepID=A0A0C2ZLI9_9AGAM|nr:hypothetical protein SCLCIDRAFT_434226 [Scleroderma citrinum Foug A]